jgi:hypothetical protein
MAKKLGRLIAFAPQHDRPGINPATGSPWRDATRAFIPEAKAFMRFHGCPEDQLYIIDNARTATQMRERVYRAIEEETKKGELRGVAFFCHGFKSGIQFGIRMPNVGDLVGRLAKNCAQDVRVTFYCCDAGRDADNDKHDDLEEFGGDDGFADHVRDRLCVEGRSHCVVDAHTSTAHTTMNPDVRRFEGMGSPVGGAGGYYLVPRKKWALFSKWRAALKTDVRFQFPFWPTAMVHQHLMTGV